MTNCNHIKRLIDEAEQIDLLPFEATHHLNGCAPCRQFAAERASVRALLNQMPRVNAPVNFDAQLKARLTQTKAKPAFAWASPALYLRFGAAAAVLVVAVFVAQYNGMFSSTNNPDSKSSTPPITNLLSTQDGNSSSSPIAKGQDDSDIKPPATPTVVEPVVNQTYIATTQGRGKRPDRAVVVQLKDDSMPGRVPNFLVRGVDRREVELPMLPVSLGAQQQLINRSSRSAVQPIAISF